MSCTYEEAIEFAVHCHEGQTRAYTFDPFVVHPLRVAGRVVDPDAKIVAVLHDALDCGGAHFSVHPGLTRGKRYLPLTKHQANALDALRRLPGEDDRTHVRRIWMAGEVATMVAIADWEDNIADLPADHDSRSVYERAIGMLRGLE